MKKSIIISTLASLIAIFVFITGKTDISNVFNKSISFDGKWNEPLVKELVTSELYSYGDFKKYGVNCSFESCVYEHKFYSANYIQYTSGEKGYIVIAYTRANDAPELSYSGCHACRVKLSLFEFKKVKNQWVMINKLINISEIGSWGEPPNIKTMEVGKNIFGVITENSYTAQGETEHYTNIYAKVGDEFKNIFYSRTQEYTSESSCPDWKSIITFSKKGNFFYDLIMKRKSSKKCKKVQSQSLYKFNGEKYEESRTYR